jgi:uncharacterized protein (DUF2147 family)
MSNFITSPTTELPTRSTMAAIRSGLTSFFGRRASQVLLAAAGASMMTASAGAADAFELEGYWLTKDGQSIVEIAPCSNSHKRLCGSVVWTSSDNAEVGSTVLQSFRLGGNLGGDKWEKGKVFADGAKKGKKGKLTLKGETLKVSTCKGQRCKSSTWSRPTAAMTAEAGLQEGAE